MGHGGAGSAAARAARVVVGDALAPCGSTGVIADAGIAPATMTRASTALNCAMRVMVDGDASGAPGAPHQRDHPAPVAVASAAVNLLPNRWYLPLFMPSTLCLVMIAIGAWLLWRASRSPEIRRSPRAGMAVLAAGLSMLYLLSTPWIATLLAATLERRCPAIAPEQAPASDAIVVLAGGEGAYMRPDGSIDMFMQRAGDRFETGLRAFRTGKAPIIAFGGGGAPIPGGPSISDTVRHRAIERGIPAGAILVGGPALYTDDESAGIAAQLRERGVQRILLCTSASHMPRATLLYERFGLQVTPLPCDFETRGEAERFTWRMLLPRALALAQSENALKEWLGLARYGLLDPD
jgi:uncharacterized SAM-binding protein YcdF (DUF218 family)